MLRLQTRAQFQATLAGGTVARTTHFALHRLCLKQAFLDFLNSKLEKSIQPNELINHLISIKSDSDLNQTLFFAPHLLNRSKQSDKLNDLNDLNDFEIGNLNVNHVNYLNDFETAIHHNLNLFNWIWLSPMTAKRFARHAVRRNLIKRQIHAIANEYMDVALLNLEQKRQANLSKMAQHLSENQNFQTLHNIQNQEKSQGRVKPFLLQESSQNMLFLHIEPAAYVVRLKTAFDPKQFISASSDQLKKAVRQELRTLFDRAQLFQHTSYLIATPQGFTRASDQKEALKS